MHSILWARIFYRYCLKKELGVVPVLQNYMYNGLNSQGKHQSLLCRSWDDWQCQQGSGKNYWNPRLIVRSNRDFYFSFHEGNSTLRRSEEQKDEQIYVHEKDKDYFMRPKLIITEG